MRKLIQSIHSLAKEALDLSAEAVKKRKAKQLATLRARIGAAHPVQIIGSGVLDNGNEFVVQAGSKVNTNVFGGGAVVVDGRIIGTVINITIGGDPNQIIGNEPHLIAIRTLERAVKKTQAELDELNLNITNQEQTLHDSYRGRELHENFIYRLGQSIEVLQKEHAAYIRDLQVPINIVRTKDDEL